MGMYCKKCQYDLSHCKAHDCPECGTFFDPELPRTYLKLPYCPIRHARMPFRIAITVAAVLVIGYWVRFGPDMLIAFHGSGHPPISSVFSQHQTLRSQLELYANQHSGQYPTLRQLQSWEVLCKKTDIFGQIGESDRHIFGPYLQQQCMNSMTKSSTVAGPGKATVHDGWEYDEQTHTLRFVVPTQAEFNQWNLDPADAVVP